MSIKEIKENDLVLARHIPEEQAWAGNLNFFSEDEEYIQVGTWGYDNGKKLLAHTHNEVKREVLWTQEVLYVRKGKILAHVYNTKEEKVAELEVSEGDVIILLMGGHGYDILEDGTQVLEVKNGPYVGADADRRRL
ncbi:MULTISPECIES: hypothetical protein [unclassified Pseudoalteromonas]|uniref:hypothetical protein n=1 Tax=unclassified Pseudoalteromonas TaxID=194690 RepID=UPI0020981C31|nr:hypothetical protein [Pseudoalteromonas sp. XMcav2-N]MCO7188747.1 hypothetical protein [Pseudoalteromonas sp. XMcav2-N]